MIRKYSNGIIFVFSLLFFLVGQVSAISIDQIFQKFQKTFETSKNFSADFEETTLIQTDQNNTKSVAKGRLIFAKPNLLRKEYVDRNEPKNLAQLILVDGKTSWSYVPMLNQVTRLELKGKNKELIPGIGESFGKLKNKYNMKLVEDKVAESKDVYHVELSPKEQIGFNSYQEDKLVESIEVWIRSEDWIPVQFSFKSESKVVGEMVIIISFRNIKINQELPQSTFIFKPPKSAEVIDISDQN